jgi:hypothetical protein
VSSVHDSILLCDCNSHASTRHPARNEYKMRCVFTSAAFCSSRERYSQSRQVISSSTVFTFVLLAFFCIGDIVHCAYTISATRAEWFKIVGYWTGVLVLYLGRAALFPTHVFSVGHHRFTRASRGLTTTSTIAQARSVTSTVYCSACYQPRIDQKPAFRHSHHTPVLTFT